MSIRLAIVGASVRAAAQSALRAGFEVVGADLFADADLDGVCPITKIEDYPHGFVDWLAAQDVDAWMYTGALENYPDLVDQMAAIKPLWGVSGEALRRCRDPLELQDVFKRAGVCFPETLPLGQPPIEEVAWLAKTYRHAAGAGVWQYGEQPTNANVYAQRLIEGKSLAAIFAVSSNETALLGVAKQIVESYGYRGSIGPVQIQDSRREAFELIGECLRTSFGLRGLVGVDLVATGDEAFVIEVNPRYTASVEVFDRAHGISAMATHVACFTEAPALMQAIKFSQSVGKRVLCASEPLHVGEAFATELLGLCRVGRVADVPRPGTVIGAGEPICTILAVGASCSEVSKGLDAFADWLLSRCGTRG
jgi:predicted ATP-grasp superfamily ATP-dependent carboligase